MAGQTGYQGIRDGLQRMWLDGEAKMKIDVAEAALEAGIAGEEMVKHVIATTESSLRPGKDNRNWTFHMTQSVDAAVKNVGTTTTIRVGWLNTQEAYFLIQNDGGELVRGSHTTTITPMNALMAGQVEVLKTLTRWGLKTV